MTEEQMKAMELGEAFHMTGDPRIYVRRIPNGWMYEYYDTNGNIEAAVPVYEVLPIKEQALPRLP